MLQVTVEINEHVEVVDVSNLEGAQGVGDTVEVHVVDTRSAPPPIPNVSVVQGSNPARIDVNGYVSWIFVCDNTTNEFLWRVIALYDLAYVESFVVGDTPDGFMPFFDGISECYVGGTDVPSKDMQRTVVIAHSWLGDCPEDCLQVAYCVDAEGTVIPCSSEQ
jgi:hypothetical protein